MEYWSGGYRGRERPQRPGTGGGTTTTRAESAPAGFGKGDSVERSRFGEGNIHSSTRSKGSKMPVDSKYVPEFLFEENSFFLEFRRSPSNKASAAPFKTPDDIEVAKSKGRSRQSSPGIVARLMGLDVFPSVQVDRNHKETRSESTSRRFLEKLTSHEGRPSRDSVDEGRDFIKDVFEIAETFKAEKGKDEIGRKGKSSHKRNDLDMTAIRERFMDAKRLSGDGAYRKTREFDDALEGLDHNKDAFLKFLQEENPSFDKNLQELKCPARNARYITVLKSSKVARDEAGERRQKALRNDNIRSLQRSEASRANSPHGGICSSLSQASSQLHAGNGGCLLHPTRIVILKPSLEKPDTKARAFLLPHSTGDIRFEYERHGGLRGLNAKGVAPVKPRRSEITGGGRAKSSREIAREVTEHMRHTVSSNAKKVPVLDWSDYKEDNRSALGMNDALSWASISGRYDYQSDSASSLSSHSARTSVIREARRHLSERWKMANRFKERPVQGGPSTLGEMLESSDRTRQDPRFIASDADKILVKDRSNSSSRRLRGISGRDHWNGDSERRALKSSSFVAPDKVPVRLRSGTGQNSSNASKYEVIKDAVGSSLGESLEDLSYRSNPQEGQPVLGVEESDLIEREIHVATEVLRDVHSRPCHRLETPKVSGDDVVGSASGSDGCLEVSLSSNEDTCHQLLESPVVPEDTPEPRSDIQLDEIAHEEFTFDHHYEANHLSTATHCQSTGPEADHPSPVSVLQLPEEEVSSSSCFESVSADLKELRMQLRLLRMETSNTYADDEGASISNEDDGDDDGEFCQSIAELEEVLNASECGEERDYSYLMDVLTDFGIHGDMDSEKLMDACHLLGDWRHSEEVFDGLERRYGGTLDSWKKKPERKLFFDLLTDAAAEVLEPHAWPKVRRCLAPAFSSSPECVVEEVRRKAAVAAAGNGGRAEVLEPRWFDSNEGACFVGMEVEEAVVEGLLEEILCELPFF